VTPPEAKPEPQSPTTKLLQQILDVSQANLVVSKQLLESAQSSNEYLKQIAEQLTNFIHNYTVTVEQIVLTKPMKAR
jgi:hypothetical protein